MTRLPLRKTGNTTTGVTEASGEQNLDMEMIAIEPENDKSRSSVDSSTGIEGESVKLDDVQKSSRIDADQQVKFFNIPQYNPLSAGTRQWKV